MGSSKSLKIPAFISQSANWKKIITNLISSKRREFSNFWKIPFLGIHQGFVIFKSDKKTWKLLSVDSQCDLHNPLMCFFALWEMQNIYIYMHSVKKEDTKTFMEEQKANLEDVVKSVCESMNDENSTTTCDGKIKANICRKLSN